MKTVSVLSKDPSVKRGRSNPELRTSQGKVRLADEYHLSNVCPSVTLSGES